MLGANRARELNDQPFKSCQANNLSMLHVHSTPVTEDADSEEEDVTSNLCDIAVLFACSGKTLVEMKAMDSEEQKVHLAKLVKDRGIKAARVGDVAAATSCPSEHGTRDKRIEWLFNYILMH
jgi:3-deoxy-D-arabino-heptulosonate 7-phosphate (DAHP) synthase